MKKFKPIILGTDKNAYSMAKSFHQAYGVRCLALGKKRMYPTRYSRIVTVEVFPNFDSDEVFLQTLLKIGKDYCQKYEKLILISCGDSYTELLVRHKDELLQYFVVPYINQALHEKLENKDNFYQMCEKHQLDYPKTFVCRFEDYKALPKNFQFPVAVKAADSIRYLEVEFPGRKKAYKASSQKELEDIVDRIFSAGYRGNIIIQDYIPGDDSAGWVLNTYSDANGKVKMMCLGDVVLEHYGPYEIGNYAAIISSYNKELYDKFKDFLEKIGYVGFAHFDLKYDSRDGKYKLFEINLRQGRSYYVTGAGCNMGRLVVDEYVYQKKQPLIYCDKNWLWLDVPKSVLLKYANPLYHKQIKELLKKGKYGYTLFYWQDFSPPRLALVLKLHNINKKMFRLYFNKRGLFG